MGERMGRNGVKRRGQEEQEYKRVGVLVASDLMFWFGPDYLPSAVQSGNGFCETGAVEDGPCYRLHGIVVLTFSRRVSFQPTPPAPPAPLTDHIALIKELVLRRHGEHLPLNFGDALALPVHVVAGRGGDGPPLHGEEHFFRIVRLELVGAATVVEVGGGG